MQTFGDQLRAIEKEREVRAAMTPVEVSFAVKQIKADAMKAVTENRQNVIFHLDNFRSACKEQLVKGSELRLELALRAEGLSARYEEDLGCGMMCPTRNCPDKTHWGYVITWSQPKK